MLSLEWKGVLSVLVDALGADDVETRSEAARGLGEAGDPAAVSAIIVALGDQPPAGGEAVGALVRIGGPAISALIRALGDGNDLVRRAAAWAVGDIGDPAAVPALIRALSDKPGDVRIEAAGALGDVGDTTGVPALSKRLRDQDRFVRDAARRAISKIMRRAKQETGEIEN